MAANLPPRVQSEVEENYQDQNQHLTSEVGERTPSGHQTASLTTSASSQQIEGGHSMDEELPFERSSSRASSPLCPNCFIGAWVVVSPKTLSVSTASLISQALSVIEEEDGDVTHRAPGDFQRKQ